MAFSFNKLCSNVVPMGKYKVQVTDIKFKSNSTGESCKDIMIIYTIVDGPQAKRTIPDNIPEKAYSFKLKPFLTACKVDLNKEFNTMEELCKYGFNEAKGKTILVDVTITTYNGREYNNVSNCYPLPGSTTSSDEVLQSFNVEPTVKAAPVENIPVTPAVEAEPQLEIPDLGNSLNYSDDDIRF